jgi:formylglycine-generating enzyme required for sulfatase activity
MEIEKGIELLMAACESVLREDHLGSIMKRAVAASKQGDIDAAIECVKKAASIIPTHSDPMVMLGLLLQEKSQRVTAMGYFRKAISQDANNALALWYLACNELSGGRFPEALALLSAAAECEPVDSYAIVTLAWLFQQIGQPANAVPQIRNKLQKQQPALICPALAWLLLCQINVKQQVPPNDNLSQKCLRNLHNTCQFNVNHKKIFEAIAAKSQKTRLQVQNLRIGAKCQLLLHNPALESYEYRFGERLVANYSRRFFDMILGPEIESIVHRNNLSRDGARLNSREIPTDMVVVPAGEYTIGCNLPALKHPEKRCYVRDFLIDRYPVTNTQWQEFDPNHTFPKGFENHPVTNVDCIQATMYARWKGKRLPTEVEWEAAARGPEGLKYPWGGSPYPGRANCGDSKPRATTPVTRYPQGTSACGALDMLGNALEWVNEWGPATGVGNRIAKGGGFAIRVADLACWLRSYYPVLTKNQQIGFRCAMNL